MGFRLFNLVNISTSGVTCSNGIARESGIVTRCTRYLALCVGICRSVGQCGSCTVFQIYAQGIATVQRNSNGIGVLRYRNLICRAGKCRVFGRSVLRKCNLCGTGVLCSNHTIGI